MAGFQQRELSGSLFKNDRKEQANHPDYRGDTLIGGVAYWVSGWIKEGARGKWMSLAFTRKADKDQPGSAASAPSPTFDDPDDLDDIPF